MIKTYKGKIKLETNHRLLNGVNELGGAYVDSPVPRTIEKAFSLFEDSWVNPANNSCGLNLRASDHHLHVQACSEGDFKVIDNENYLMLKTDKYELEIYRSTGDKEITAGIELSRRYFHIEHLWMLVKIRWWRNDRPIQVSMRHVLQDAEDNVKKLWNADHVVISNQSPNESVKLRQPKEVA